MPKLNKKDGFASLMEVIITAIIFTLSAYGILTTISMMRPLSDDSGQQLQSTFLRKTYIDGLRGQLNAEAWNDPTTHYTETTGTTPDGTVSAITSFRGTILGKIISSRINVTTSVINVPGYPDGEGPRQITINTEFSNFKQ